MPTVAVGNMPTAAVGNMPTAAVGIVPIAESLVAAAVGYHHFPLPLSSSTVEDLVSVTTAVLPAVVLGDEHRCRRFDHSDHLLRRKPEGCARLPLV